MAGTEKGEQPKKHVVGRKSSGRRSLIGATLVCLAVVAGVALAGGHSGATEVLAVSISEASPPAPAPDAYVDLGNPEDEAFHDLAGWGGSQGPPDNPFVSPSGDRTKRYQLLKEANSVELFVQEAGRAYTLITEVEDGSCTDNFELLVNGQGPIYSYVGRHLGNEAVVHTVPVAATLVPLPQVTVTFQNTATGGCGGAAVYNVSLVPESRSAEIDIKPGSDDNPINPKSRGVIPVAVLSSPDFDAPSQVDMTSLTFGRTGDEKSLAKCAKRAKDVNGDGLPDQVCHFHTQDTGFQCGDAEGVLQGQTVGGVPFDGRDSVRTIPCR